MSLGFNVVLALFVLAPGLAVLGGIWLGTQSGKYLPAPPPPNSLLSLALVAIGALFVHAATALIFAIGRLVQVGLLLAGQYWRSFGPLWDVPNPYVTILGLRDAVPGEGAIAMILTLFCLQSVLAFALVGHVIRKDVSKGHYTRALYGWLSDLVEKSGRPERYVTAFVLTGVEKDGRFLGYEGLLEKHGPDVGQADRVRHADRRFDVLRNARRRSGWPNGCEAVPAHPVAHYRRVGDQERRVPGFRARV